MRPAPGGPARRAVGVTGSGLPAAARAVKVPGKSFRPVVRSGRTGSYRRPEGVLGRA